MLTPGLVSVTMRKLDPPSVLALCRSAELRCIEWGGDIHVPPGDLRLAREVGEMTRESGIEVAAYGSYYRAGRSEDEGLPFERVLETAVELGAPLVRVWAGTKGSEAVDDEERWKIIADLRRIAAVAANRMVNVALEFHQGTLTDTNDSAGQLLVETGSANIRSLWQPVPGRKVDDCLEGLRVVLPLLANVHCFHWKNEGNERLALADGAAEWWRYLECVASSGRDHGVMLEFVKDDDPDQVVRDAATLREWLSEVGGEGR